MDALPAGVGLEKRAPPEDESDPEKVRHEELARLSQLGAIDGGRNLDRCRPARELRTVLEILVVAEIEIAFPRELDLEVVDAPVVFDDASVRRYHLDEFARSWVGDLAQ